MNKILGNVSNIEAQNMWKVIKDTIFKVAIETSGTIKTHT